MGGNYQDFEDEERDRFLDGFLTYEQACLQLDDVNLDSMPKIREKTKTGLELGVQDFMATQGDCDSLYLSDMHEFYYDTSTEKMVKEQLEPLSLGDTNAYAQNVCEMYAMFVYQDSMERFKERFG